jgi:hypothetical protein
MKIRKPRTAVAMLCGILALGFAGCQSAPQVTPADAKAAADRADADDEARRVAEASLGKDAAMLAHGNLALNGSEQVLVVNRFSTGAAANAGGANSSPIFITRAAVLEKKDGNWSQILLCDEHLKNPYGYLRGSLAERVSGWRMEYRQDAKDGLEMKFAPVESFDAAHMSAAQSSEQKSLTFDVRWNPGAKRYQSFDNSHERYLSEVPTLETPQSTLK